MIAVDKRGLPRIEEDGRRQKLQEKLHKEMVHQVNVLKRVILVPISALQCRTWQLIGMMV